MTILTAQIAKVPFGTVEIDGLMFEDGSYGIAVPQIAKLILPLDSQNQGSQTFKRLMGKDFKTHKAKTNFNRNVTLYIELESFVPLLRKSAQAGNKLANVVIDQLVGLSLHQLFSDAFGVQFEKEDRQLWLVRRQLTKDTFWWFTDEIKVWLENREVKSSCPQVHYINSFKAMSIGLFGKSPKRIKEELGIFKGELNRDHFGRESLARIESVQRLAKANLLNGDRVH